MSDLDKAFEAFASTKQGDEMISLLADKMSIGYGLAYQVAKSWFEQGYIANQSGVIAA